MILYAYTVSKYIDLMRSFILSFSTLVALG